MKADCLGISETRKKSMFHSILIFDPEVDLFMELPIRLGELQNSVSRYICVVFSLKFTCIIIGTDSTCLMKEVLFENMNLQFQSIPFF